jgi:phosphoglucosamine mutase
MDGIESRQERLFGTDGIRGTPGVYPLTDGMIFKIGLSAAKLLLRTGKKDKNCKIVIGKDTRLSGDRIEIILSDAAKFYSIDVVLAGTIPTPGLSFLVRHLNADMGVMISASHNKATDNGIKFFTKGGSKLSPEEESWMEELLLGSLIHASNGQTSKKKGDISRYPQAANVYKSFLNSTVKDTPLGGLKVVLDCAWGATSGIAPSLFRELGIDTETIHDIPDGANINLGGALDPSVLKAKVLEKKADCGFAFDGDGDRVVLVDEKGNVLDGDYIMAIIGLYLLEKNKLSKDTLVASVMSNYGLKRALGERGGKLLYTPVGDKYLMEKLIKQNLNLGGEQSGHIILKEYSISPDGMLVALQILKIIKETKKPLGELAGVMQKLPQILVNVKVKHKKPLHTIPSLWEAITQSNKKLKNSGRLLVRYSGTEPLARIMVEGEDERIIEEIALSLRDIFEKELGIGKTEN